MIGAVLPILIVLLSSADLRIPMIMTLTLVGLVALGAAGARVGGAPWKRAAARVLIGGVLALVISLAIGRLSGSVI